MAQGGNVRVSANRRPRSMIPSAVHREELSRMFRRCSRSRARPPSSLQTCSEALSGRVDEHPAARARLTGAPVQTGTITGSVTDPGCPIPGATVQRNSGRGLAEVQTNRRSAASMANPARSADRDRPGFTRSVLSARLHAEHQDAPEPALFRNAQATRAAAKWRSDLTTAARSFLVGLMTVRCFRLTTLKWCRVSRCSLSRVAITTQTAMMRGPGARVKSLVLADGVPLNDAFGGGYWDGCRRLSIASRSCVAGGDSAARMPSAA